MIGLPKITAERRSPERCEFEILVEPENPWFRGHFPGFAILPGVVQIGWAEHYARTLYGFDGGIAALEQVKFRRPIQPGAKLTLALRPDAAVRRVRYEYRDAEASYSSGVLQFGGTP